MIEVEVGVPHGLRVDPVLLERFGAIHSGFLAVDGVAAQSAELVGGLEAREPSDVGLRVGARVVGDVDAVLPDGVVELALRGVAG